MAMVHSRSHRPRLPEDESAGALADDEAGHLATRGVVVRYREVMGGPFVPQDELAPRSRRGDTGCWDSPAASNNTPKIVLLSRTGHADDRAGESGVDVDVSLARHRVFPDHPGAPPRETAPWPCRRVPGLPCSRTRCPRRRRGMPPDRRGGRGRSPTTDSYAAYMLDQMVLPPNAGMSIARRLPMVGGDGSQVTSVCQLS